MWGRLGEILIRTVDWLGRLKDSWEAMPWLWRVFWFLFGPGAIVLGTYEIELPFAGKVLFFVVVTAIWVWAAYGWQLLRSRGSSASTSADRSGRVQGAPVRTPADAVSDPLLDARRAFVDQALARLDSEARALLRHMLVVGRPQPVSTPTWEALMEAGLVERDFIGPKGIKDEFKTILADRLRERTQPQAGGIPITHMFTDVGNATGQDKVALEHDRRSYGLTIGPGSGDGIYVYRDQLLDKQFPVPKELGTGAIIDIGTLKPWAPACNYLRKDERAILVSFDDKVIQIAVRHVWSHHRGDDRNGVLFDYCFYAPGTEQVEAL